ncbi:MAG: hypothetical protein HFI90_05190 [Clostridia bacterium]|nr:hypothetical protein [Clostridia bacterium]
MFGYIQAAKEELKIKEWNTFRAYYCGLCKTQGKLLGPVTRMGLSYDFTVLSILLDSVRDSQTKIVQGRCMLNPLRKRPVAAPCEALEYCAYMSVELTYYKIKDDMLDHTICAGIAALPFYAPPHKKVKRAYAEKAAVIEQHLQTLHKLETENCRNVDEVAEQFAKIMEEVFAMPGLEDRALRALGYNLGRWLYLADAIDDFEKDREKGQYNPFSTREEILGSAVPLWYNLGEAAKAYELLDLKKNKGLLDNIIYLGLQGTTRRLLEKYDSGENAAEKRQDAMERKNIK